MERVVPCEWIAARFWRERPGVEPARAGSEARDGQEPGQRNGEQRKRQRCQQAARNGQRKQAARVERLATVRDARARSRPANGPPAARAV